MLVFFISLFSLHIALASQCVRYLSAAVVHSQLEASLGFILKNTGRRAGGLPGSVIASSGPTNPAYHYHWVRDAALTHIELLKWLREASTEHPLYDEIKAEVMAAPDFARKLQLLDVPEGAGTPKFGVDATKYTGVNATPQKDGPALRALSMLELGDYLLSRNEVERATRMLLSTDVLKHDLDYLMLHWKERLGLPLHEDPAGMSRESWEEIPAESFFYNSMVQRAAFVKAAEFYKKLGLRDEFRIYSAEAKKIEALFDSFWNEELGLFEFAKGDHWTKKWSFNRDSRTDVLVMLGALHGNTGDGFMSLSDPRMQSTVYHIVKGSQKKFALNNNVEDGAFMIFRYLEDDWDGVNRHAEGYPWVLATAGYSQYLAGLQSEFIKAEKIIVTSTNIKFINETVLLNSEGINSVHDGIYQKGTAEFDLIVNALEERSYAVYGRLLRLASREGGHMAEGMNPAAEADGGGVGKGPEDLTWSHVSIFSAARALSLPITFP